MSLKISTLYLLAYNSFQAIGWFVSLINILYNLLSTSSITGTYASAGTLISQYYMIMIIIIYYSPYSYTPNH